LNELAAALGNDPNFATTVTNALALKAPLASPSLTGTPVAPTAPPGTNTTQLATTAFVAAVQALLAPLASPVLTGNPTAPTPANGDNDTSIATSAFVQGLGAGAKVYQATLTQSGSSAPTAQVLANFLGGSVVWARTSAGLYTATLSGAFTANKTQVFIGNVTGVATHFVITPVTLTSANVITLETKVVNVTVPSVVSTDGLLNATAIMIVVYP